MGSDEMIWAGHEKTPAVCWGHFNGPGQTRTGGLSSSETGILRSLGAESGALSQNLVGVLHQLDGFIGSLTPGDQKLLLQILSDRIRTELNED